MGKPGGKPQGDPDKRGQSEPVLEGSKRLELRRAVALALGGDWQAAHLIAQEYDDDRTASWIHAVVHRMEGDLANARYWYGRCGRELRPDVSTQSELREIEAELGG